MTPIPRANSKKTIDIQTHHGFSQSPTNANVIFGGRPVFSDALSTSPSFSNIDAGSPNHSGSHFIVKPNVAHKLAAEEEELIKRHSPTFKPHPDDFLKAGHGAAPTSSGPLMLSLTEESYGAIDDVMDSETESIVEIAKAWDDAVDNNEILTSFANECKYVLANAGPLVFTFLLQSTLTASSVFFVGHLGKSYLAAVSLGSMTISITGIAFIQGMATCLDTLCPQSYGAKQYTLVGEYLQKCIAMTLVYFIPIGLLWLFSEPLFYYIVPKDDPAVAALAASYLKVALCGIPGFTCFECGKRFVQAQGIYSASSYVLFFCAPFNMLLTYLLVWHPSFGFGYIGAAISVATTQWLMAILLLSYVRFVDGMKCWGGISSNIFKNWGPMISLAIPGVIMIEAEFFAFEILTFCASVLGTTQLATQSVVSVVATSIYQIPFSVSIVSSNRIANFIGASLTQNARIAKKAGLIISIFVGLFDGLGLYLMRNHVGPGFSEDPDVIAMCLKTIPVIALLCCVDAPSAMMGGILRGFGRPKIGGYFNLFFFYFQALPLAVFLGFKCGLGIEGFWISMSIAILLICSCEYIYVQTVDWDKLVEEAKSRQGIERIDP
ncbi:uncharacterized protein SAPINGB_P001220 [Magnusiomyces paraingens]|uniref:MATE efflux family protein n=1 Tax=Magnusiomyces paraingens TaxID=2606893 RepID=A0A5E8B4L1_9ASCO|nr:uncharacterized protein SAPINGB_P001220 [Saprochaete ingens]VVT46451.1 unnamed protein product [Saprochaete ingens]